MKKILLEITDELAEAIDSAKGTAARNAYIESRLRRDKEIKAAAKELEIVFPDRPLEGRGKWDREP